GAYIPRGGRLRRADREGKEPMTRRLGAGIFAAPLLVAMAWAGEARAEVYAEVGPDGHLVATHIVAPRGHPGRIWEPTGAAEMSSYVLNPNGSLHGDGRPDIAINPVAGFARAVWAQRAGHSYDIVTSIFIDGAWTPPMTINSVHDADNLD